MDIKSIPAFYCCYLLRSTVRHASLYVGSTPTPARRLAQHNGKVKGGAVRTSRVSLRPWEMTCIVAGFPSNIAALQFEWAWQNAHLTRHISPDERISFATTLTQTSSRTGKSRKRPGRPRTSLIDKLSNLHLLLRVPYFSQWPLEIRFFNEEVYRVWQTWCERVDTSIRPGIKIFLDLPQAATEQEITSGQQPAKRRKIDLLGKGGVEGVDPTYARFQDVLEKSQFLLDDGDDQSCSVCQRGLDLKHDLYVICPHQVCRNISHVTCLANKFLDEEKGKSVVPTNGKCPSCHGALEWSELMREISLRTRGEKEVLKLLSKKRRTKAATAAEIMETDSEEEDEVREAKELTAVEFDEGYDDDDLISVASLESSCSRLAQVGQDPRFEPTANSLEIVIEDSDSDPDMRF